VVIEIRDATQKAGGRLNWKALNHQDIALAQRLIRAATEQKWGKIGAPTLKYEAKVVLEMERQPPMREVGSSRT